ncbi:MAG: GGDEF domain-containing protein [Burkholderiales bacterium]|nr:GGDEF domain-containing protein [Burkholderiales bacterium]
MTVPIQILCVSTRPFDLWDAPFGPFVVRQVQTLADAAAGLQPRGLDAMLVDATPAGALAALAAWPLLAQAVLDVAVLVLAAEPGAAEAVALVQAGVQDVLPPTDAASLARILRLAVERKRLEAAARKAYATDLATGLPNPTQLLEHMTHLVALRAREPAPMALVVLRVEGLAATEAALGVEAANVLRRKVAVRLRSGLRASDVVASLGADTFAVLLAWLDAADAAPRVAGKLAQALTQPFSITGRERRVGVRMGLASFPEHGEQAEDLLRRALAQAAQMATLGSAGGTALAVDRSTLGGPLAAANDED